MLLEKVVQAIAEKWPRGQWAATNFIIRIQQDGPQTHIPEKDEQFDQGLVELGVEHKLLIYNQPANSPDCNINDLGFFRALDAAYHNSAPRDTKELMEFVQQAHAEYDPRKINRIYLTLQCVLNQILEHHGDNNFKIPHLGKEKLEKENRLPLVLPVTQQASQYLDSM